MKWILTLLLMFASSAWAEKTFVYCSEASPSTFNPQMADDGPTFNASSQMIYNRLIEFSPGGTKPIPALAKSWTISHGGTVYTFHLRENVKFQTTPYFKPTRAFDADDVLFTFQRALDKNNPYHMVNGGNYIYYTGMGLDKLIKKIEKVDEHTVRFVLTRPEAPFLADLGMSFAVILSKEYADQMLKAKTPEKVDIQPIGTGPFILKRYVKDNSIRYVANPDYWQGKPKLDQVVFSITPDADVRYQKLKTGECNLIAEPSPEDLKGMQADTHLKVMSQPGANIGYLAFNVQKAPFNKVEVRQAIAYALNRKNYLDVVYKGTAELATSPLPPTVWGSNPHLKGYTYNIKKAKALLKKAGYPNGFHTELWTLPVARPYNPSGKKMGELMQADLAKIGIQVRLVTYDRPTYLEKSRKGEAPMIQMGWTTDNGDPDNFLYILLSCDSIASGANVARWCDKSFDKLVMKAKRITNMKARTKLYWKAQEIFEKQVPWVTLGYAKVFRGMSRNLTGYHISPLGVEDFYPLDLR